jgi:hypothetical protein
MAFVRVILKIVILKQLVIKPVIKKLIGFLILYIKFRVFIQNIILESFMLIKLNKNINKLTPAEHHFIKTSVQLIYFYLILVIISINTVAAAYCNHG